MALTLKPTALAVGGLVLDKATLDLEHIAVLGDVAPDERTQVGNVSLDLNGGAQSFPLAMAPQGLYSRVRFEIEDALLHGTYNGTPISIGLTYLDIDLDLRANTPRELGPGMDAQFEVDIDPNAWFAGVSLDLAGVDDGRIEINAHDNAFLAQLISAQMPGSFSLEGGGTLDTSYGEQGDP